MSKFNNEEVSKQIKQEIKQHRQKDVKNINPTAEQLADKNNIWGLIWRTRKELARIGLTPRMCKKYGCSGFNKILRQHMSHETDKYSPEIVEEIVKEYRVRLSNGEIHSATYSVLRKAGLMLEEFHQTGLIKWKVARHWNTRQPTAEFDLCINAYVDYAMYSGEYAETTIYGTKINARTLVFELEDCGHLSFANVTLLDISDALTAIMKRYALGSLKKMVGDMRRFLRFLYHKSHTGIDLSIAIPERTVGHRSFGYGFTREEILSILDSINTESPFGKRDLAMFTLAAQTGLRSIDIASLKRENIDWRAKEIRLVQHKTGKPFSLPLEPESGNAIADYLLTARPKCDLSNIFITHTLPLRELIPKALQERLRKYMRISKIAVIPRRGVHSFRRSFGTRLLENETPIELLHQMLGQTCIESVKPYISVNDTGLKMCALNLISAKEGVVRE